MKFAAAIACALLFAGPAQAVEDWDNWLSFVWDPASTAYDFNCRYQEIDQTITLTLWLVRPVNPDFGDGVEQPVTRVGGFDCSVTMTEGLNLLGWTLPQPGVLYAQDGHLFVRYDEPLAVVAGRAALATCEVYVGNISSFTIPETIMARCVHHDNAWTYVAPAPLPVVPGQVSYVDADDPQDPNVVPHTFAETDLQFEIVRSIVAGAEPTWGALKALYH